MCEKKYIVPFNDEEKEAIINKIGEDVFSWSNKRMDEVEYDIDCRDKDFAFRNEFIPKDERTEENRKIYEAQLVSEDRLNDIKTLLMK